MSRIVHRAGWRWVSLAVGLSLGCSVLTVRPPRASVTQPGAVECEQSAVPAVIDLLLMGATFYGTGKAMPDRDSRGTTLFVGGIALSVATISFLYGAKNVARCEALKKAALAP
jgi:hypothetical protein